MNPLYIHRSGLWAPGYDGVEAWLAGCADPEIRKPSAALLDGPLKRRASMLTRLAIDAFAQAADGATTEQSELGAIWGTVRGETWTAIDLMKMMYVGEGKLSPTKFHNSVYNTAGGYASIVTVNRMPSTTLTGGPEIVAMVLLEASGLLAEGAPEVVATWADETYPPPFESARPCDPLAVALRVSNDSRGALARLSDLRQEEIEPIEPPDQFAEIYPSAALALIDRVANRTAGRLPIELASPERSVLWSVMLDFDSL